mgnify:CR=1 FL=1
MSVQRMICCDFPGCYEFISDAFSSEDIVPEIGPVAGAAARAGWTEVALPCRGPGRESVEIHICNIHNRKGVPLDTLDDARLLQEWHA